MNLFIDIELDSSVFSCLLFAVLVGLGLKVVACVVHVLEVGARDAEFLLLLDARREHWSSRLPRLVRDSLQTITDRMSIVSEFGRSVNSSAGILTRELLNFSLYCVLHKVLASLNLAWFCLLIHAWLHIPLNH